MNQVVLIGNLTRDPELRYSTGASQTAICRFTVAVNDRRRNPQTQNWEDHPSFIPVVVFGRSAENCEKYLAKGRKVAVNGRIQTGSYTNKEGNTVYTTEVIANNVEFLSARNDAGSGYGQNQGFGGSQGGYGGQQGGFDQSQGGFGQSQDSGFGGHGDSFDQPQGGASGNSGGSSQDDIPPGFQAVEEDDLPF